MSIPNQALANLLQEIEAQATQSQQQVAIVKSQILAKQREIRMRDLTSKEVASLPSDTKIYEGVGKMFVFSPTANLNKRLRNETDELKSDVKNLEKKLQYLETTYKNSRGHIDQILKSGGHA
ncbi:hypothetical protein K3495_g6843 [Podosphaera aphanis]|nr:hypothetical protein K3495_g6843 [Podosphaera aphanis]